MTDYSKALQVWVDRERMLRRMLRQPVHRRVGLLYDPVPLTDDYIHKCILIAEDYIVHFTTKMLEGTIE